jgi:hypothetical protein
MTLSCASGAYVPKSTFRSGSRKLAFSPRPDLNLNTPQAPYDPGTNFTLSPDVYVCFGRFAASQVEYSSMVRVAIVSIADAGTALQPSGALPATFSWP